jgi:hypothetical protein
MVPKNIEYKMVRFVKEIVWTMLKIQMYRWKLTKIGPAPKFEL